MNANSLRPSHALSSTRTRPHGRASHPCSHPSTSTDANATGAVGPGPRHPWTRMSKTTGDLVSVKIIPNEKGSSPAKPADAG